MTLFLLGMDIQFFGKQWERIVFNKSKVMYTQLSPGNKT